MAKTLISLARRHFDWENKVKIGSLGFTIEIKRFEVITQNVGERS